MRVISIYGTRDGVAAAEKVQAAVPLLHAGTVYFPLEDGNHAQFGFYSSQRGDRAAAISREIQQDLIVEAMISFLRV